MVVQGDAATRPRSSRSYFLDLHDPSGWSQRPGPRPLSDSRTNTFPTWAPGAPLPLRLAQRRDQHVCAATSTGCAPAKRCSSPTLFGEDIKKILPIIDESGSDSGHASTTPSNCSSSTGRSLPHAVMMMIPEPWQKHDPFMSDEQARLLRVPLVHHGAVGRPRVHRFHRRHPNRRGPRPQRSAPVALRTSPRTISSSWRPRSVYVEVPPERRPHRRAGSSRAACSSSITEKGRIDPRRRVEGGHGETATPTADWLKRQQRLAERFAARAIRRTSTTPVRGRRRS